MCVCAQLLTSSYDCTIRQLSFVSGLSREIFALDGILISSFDMPPSGNELWISDAKGGLSHVDLRSARFGKRWQMNEKEKIGSVSINPVNPNFLVSASNDRTVKWVRFSFITLFLTVIHIYVDYGMHGGFNKFRCLC